MPTLIADYLPVGREVLLQSENGILGMGPAAEEAQKDYGLINAGKQFVTLLTGGSYFHHADSFAMMRGGHIDICVLGAYQVSEYGDLATLTCGPAGLEVVDIVDGLCVAELEGLLHLPLRVR